MGLRLIRQESETPNVSNHDDARMARYAYGGYDGYVKNRGQEIGHTISGTSFVVQSGVLNLQGWEVEVDANGVSIPTSASVTNKTYFSVYLEVNCATDTAEIKSLTDTAGFPDVPAGDDLTENTIGTARLLLYHFTATSGVIADVEKLVQEIPYGADALNAAQSENKQKFSEIEQRLDELGFKEGYVALPNGGGITLKRQGNFVLAEFNVVGPNEEEPAYYQVSLPKEFASKDAHYSVYAGSYANYSDEEDAAQSNPGVIEIMFLLQDWIWIAPKCYGAQENGTVLRKSNNYVIRGLKLGWEAPPRTE